MFFGIFNVELFERRGCGGLEIVPDGALLIEWVCVSDDGPSGALQVMETSSFSWTVKFTSFRARFSGLGPGTGQGDWTWLRLAV